MDGELTEATNTVKSSSFIQITGHNFQNPGNAVKHIWFVVRLRIGLVAASPNRLIDLFVRQ